MQVNDSLGSEVGTLALLYGAPAAAAAGVAAAAAHLAHLNWVGRLYVRSAQQLLKQNSEQGVHAVSSMCSVAVDYTFRSARARRPPDARRTAQPS